MKYEIFSSALAETVTGVQNSKGTTAYVSWGKRVLDLSLGLFALPVLLIVCAFLWVLNLRSNQKTIFAQPRVGKDGKTFNCFKFQTMVNDAEKVLEDLCQSDPAVKAEWDEFQKLENDPRITKVGRFLRKTSLDELPQVFNVLLGNMCIVGPRPFMKSQTEIYVAGGGTDYFAMKPGITGNWQIEGRGNTSFLTRISYDRLYFRRMSLKEDARIIGKTVLVLARMSGN
jgi:exopolysaccharide production protein ExoY